MWQARSRAISLGRRRAATLPSRPGRMLRSMKSLVPTQWAVPERFRERLGESVGRQRAMSEDGHLLLVLHAVPEAGDAEREARLFWRDPQGAWRSAGQGTGLGPLKAHLEQFEAAAEAQEQAIRGATDAADYFEVLKTAVPLLRTARNLHRALQEAREAVDDRELINLRDRAGEVERAADLVVSEARDGLHFTTARRSEDQAAAQTALGQQSHRLNQVTAMFLPLTALASVFSMTLRSGLEGTAAPWIFWGVVAAGVTLGLAMKPRR